MIRNFNSLINTNYLYENDVTDVVKDTATYIATLPLARLVRIDMETFENIVMDQILKAEDMLNNGKFNSNQYNLDSIILNLEDDIDTPGVAEAISQLEEMDDSEVPAHHAFAVVLVVNSLTGGGKKVNESSKDDFLTGIPTYGYTPLLDEILENGELRNEILMTIRKRFTAVDVHETIMDYFNNTRRHSRRIAELDDLDELAYNLSVEVEENTELFKEVIKEYIKKNKGIELPNSLNENSDAEKQVKRLIKRHGTNIGGVVDLSDYMRSPNDNLINIEIDNGDVYMTFQNDWNDTYEETEDIEEFSYSIMESRIYEGRKTYSVQCVPVGQTEMKTVSQEFTNMRDAEKFAKNMFKKDSAGCDYLGVIDNDGESGSIIYVTDDYQSRNTVFVPEFMDAIDSYLRKNAPGKKLSVVGFDVYDDDDDDY